ncbi:MAG: response regulator FixJ [Woeseiaceae bacterium]|nr:response regulator FixJ [Woeseiaceae bacterium]
MTRSDLSEPTVFIVDDDAAIRRAMELLLSTVPVDCESYESAEAFLAAYSPERAGCLLLDIRMPGLSGLELQRRLNELDSPLPVIFITGHGDVPMAVEAMQQGAFDFIEKPFGDDDIIERIQLAFAADRRQRSRSAERSDIGERIARLTKREQEVMDLVVQGKPNKIVAYELGVSQRTVEIHRARVMEKMEARSLAELVRMTLAAT